MEERRAQDMAERRHRHDAVVARHGEALAAKARKLVETGAVVIPTTAGEISGRIVRFRWGDAVLEVTYASTPGPYASGLTMRTRLSRRQPGLWTDVAGHRLVEAVAESGGAPLP